MSSQFVIDASYFAAAFLFIYGLKRMSSPVTARSGIVVAGIGMLVATLAVSDRYAKAPEQVAMLDATGNAVSFTGSNDIEAAGSIAGGDVRMFDSVLLPISGIASSVVSGAVIALSLAVVVMLVMTVVRRRRALPAIIFALYAVIAHGVWTREFAADRSVIGRS